MGQKYADFAYGMMLEEVGRCSASQQIWPIWRLVGHGTLFQVLSIVFVRVNTGSVWVMHGNTKSI